MGRLLFVIIRATDPRTTGRPNQKKDLRRTRRTIAYEESGQPNRKSRSLQKDGKLHHQNTSLWATKQDSPIRIQDPHKKNTEHGITGTEPPGRQIRTVEELSNTQYQSLQREKTFVIRRTVIAMSKESRNKLKHKSIYAQKPYLVHISRFEHISRFTRKSVLTRTQ